MWWKLLSDSERRRLARIEMQETWTASTWRREQANDLVLYGRRDAAGNRIAGTGLLEQAPAEYNGTSRSSGGATSYSASSRRNYKLGRRRENAEFACRI